MSQSVAHPCTLGPLGVRGTPAPKDEPKTSTVLTTFLEVQDLPLGFLQSLADARLMRAFVCSSAKSLARERAMANSSSKVASFVASMRLTFLTPFLLWCSQQLLLVRGAASLGLRDCSAKVCATTQWLSACWWSVLMGPSSIMPEANRKWGASTFDVLPLVRQRLV